MRSVEVIALVHGVRASTVYPILRDFERYPEHSEAIRSVCVSSPEGLRTTSSWEVQFRRGILRWVEEDSFEDTSHIIWFRQVEGDIDHFSGHWEMTDSHLGDCLVRFTAEFDLGIPSLGDMIEPIAEQALRDNIWSILRGLFGERTYPVESLDDATNQYDVDQEPAAEAPMKGGTAS